ncbi:MAG: mannonate dehydratase [Oscillospiraceae bacterium]|nr:mannonate dehydratase [Oscillospiraceae bacterium]
MLLTDYFRFPKDSTWDIAKQSGVSHGVIRLPETADFDLTDKSHWQTVYDGFMDYGLKPVIIEPMPNELHDHIKAGDEKRDECIEKAIKMLPIMDALDIRCICFNFMAHIGWFRTKNDIPERGGARVTGFDIKDFKPVEAKIPKDELWANYEYFIRAVLPYAEKHGIKLALHPDDPPRDLGGVERIMTSADNIDRAVNGIVKSDSLGITMCHATYHIMGEKLCDVIPRFADKIMFVHFRNTRGNINSYQETYHDNGEIDMAEVMKIYKKSGVDVPIRVDHVPTMVGEDMKNQGYDAIGRYFAIGYLKGILDSLK